MNKQNFSKWYPIPNLVGVCDIDAIKNINELDIFLIPVNRKRDDNLNKKILIHFNSYQSYTCIDESYSEEFWVDSTQKAWTFYKSNTSCYIELLKKHSILFKECRKEIVHYVIVGTNSIFHVISDEEPDISVL
jgi:hypothetical protein